MFQHAGAPLFLRFSLRFQYSFLIEPDQQRSSDLFRFWNTVAGLDLFEESGERRIQPQRVHDLQWLSQDITICVYTSEVKRNVVCCCENLGCPKNRPRPSDPEIRARTCRFYFFEFCFLVSAVEQSGIDLIARHVRSTLAESQSEGLIQGREEFGEGHVQCSGETVEPQGLVVHSSPTFRHVVPRSNDCQRHI